MPIGKQSEIERLYALLDLVADNAAISIFYYDCLAHAGLIYDQDKIIVLINFKIY